MWIILYLFLSNISTASIKGEEFVIYYESTPVGNDVDNFIAPYED